MATVNDTFREDVGAAGKIAFVLSRLAEDFRPYLDRHPQADQALYQAAMLILRTTGLPLEGDHPGPRAN